MFIQSFRIIQTLKGLLFNLMENLHWQKSDKNWLYIFFCTYSLFLKEDKFFILLKGQGSKFLKASLHHPSSGMSWTGWHQSVTSLAPITVSLPPQWLLNDWKQMSTSSMWGLRTPGKAETPLASRRSWHSTSYKCSWAGASSLQETLVAPSPGQSFKQGSAFYALNPIFLFSHLKKGPWTWKVWGANLSAEDLRAHLTAGGVEFQDKLAYYLLL